MSASSLQFCAESINVFYKICLIVVSFSISLPLFQQFKNLLPCFILFLTRGLAQLSYRKMSTDYKMTAFSNGSRTGWMHDG